MSVQTQTFATVPDWLLAQLSNHLPYSLPLLRRLQFTKLPRGTSEHARIVLVSDDTSTCFTVAYVDPAGGPDTHMWLYSTLEDKPLQHAEKAHYTQQLEATIQALVAIYKDYGRETSYPGCVLLGTVHSEVRALLEPTGRVIPRAVGGYDKWLFKTEDLPRTEVALPEGMYWDRASLEDCRVVASRTNLPRPPEKLVAYPSLVIKLTDGTPIVWAFLGPDASLMSLHCEPPYRGRGLAKILAAKLLRERTADFGVGELGSADVAPDNVASRAVCKSLNGTTWWVVSWILLKVGEKV
ncbi:hypothetical protein B0I35DRAFT_426951 [Stachybotrys elegans]|uniref:N-acetyltransferase domain-containing protein n=1 Tax=Stachybotrys elegans TaxID=80388 RepID=A0A8K0WT91_9HYPO|nr:hypothetical protein B0I35DRAFT_426951 [Stachybotrys elegans]